MEDKTLKRVVLVYLLLFPVMWLLIEGVWGGLHGALFGLKIGKALKDPQSSTEITSFMRQHGLSEKTLRKDSEQWFEKLTPLEQKEFQKIIMKSVDMKGIAGFGSTFAVCAIVFGLVGFLSGILTKAWIPVGILPLVSFLLNNPVLKFGVIRDLQFSQKAIIVVVSQFLVCYIFAYLGTMISRKVGGRRHIRTEAKP